MFDQCFRDSRGMVNWIRIKHDVAGKNLADLIPFFVPGWKEIRKHFIPVDIMLQVVSLKRFAWSWLRFQID